MKQNEFKTFKALLIKEEFAGDIMCGGYLFLRLTDKQAEEIKKEIPKHAKEFTAFPDGALKVGMFIFK